MLLEEKRKEGISLRTTHRLLVIMAVIISCLMLFSTYHLSVSFRKLTNTSEEQIEMRKAARELMDASDYLTENVQRFTVNGETRFMDDYFTEAFESNRREEALSTMAKDAGKTDALKHLQTAMDDSVKLMDMEYYIMRLVIEAKGYTDYPEPLKDVELTEQDSELSPEEKMRLANEMALGDSYYEQKEQIRENMRASLDDLERMAYETDDAALDSLRREMTAVRLVIILQIIGFLAMVWLTSRLGISPLLNAVERIKADSSIPEVGANEFRYLARTYNRMYEAYKTSLEHLNYKASHDELTGAYNRSGYELILSGLDLNSTFMMLVDVDDFKEINDTYGHDAGDKVLIKLVRALKNNFRSDDYICRIGGDEMVVFMVHVPAAQRQQIILKIREVNRDLANTDDGLPPVSVSAGIAHGSSASDLEDLFEKTDEAMYRAKHSGKNTYVFYEDGE